MKNKMLALSAAVLLFSGIAFGFSQYNNANGGGCCNVEANTCNGVPCPAGECPLNCCPSSSCAPAQ